MATIIKEARERLAKEDPAKALQEANEKVEAAVSSSDQKTQAAWLVVSSDFQQHWDDSSEATTKAVELFKELGDQAAEAIARQALAYAQLQQGSKLAVQSANEAISLFEGLGNKEGKADCLKTIMEAYLWKGQADEVLTVGEEARSLYKELGNKKGEADVLEIIASTYEAFDKVDKAKEVALEAMRLAGEAGNSEDEVSKLKTVIRVMTASSDPGRGQTLADEAVSLFSEKGDKKGQAAALQVKAEVLVAKKDIFAAVEAFASAAELYKQLGDAQKQADVLCALMQVQLEHGQVSKAGDTGEQLKELKSAEDSSGGSGTLMVAEVHFRAKKMDRGLMQAKEALQIFRGAGNAEKEAATQYAIIGAHFSSNAGIVLTAAEELTDLFHKQKKEFEEGKVAKIVADVRLAEGELDEALSSAKRARNLFKSCNAKKQEAAAMVMISRIQLQSGNSPVALETAKDALELCKSARGFPWVEEEALRAMTEAGMKLGIGRGALEAANNTLDAARKIGDQYGEASALHSLSQIYLESRDTKNAVEHAMAELEVCQESGNLGGEASAWYNLATAAFMQDPYSEDGFMQVQEAVNLYRAVDDKAGYAAALHLWAHALFMNGSLEEGLKVAREAMQMLQSVGDLSQKEELMHTIEQARSNIQQARQGEPPLRPLTKGSGKVEPVEKAPSGPGHTVCKAPQIMMDEDLEDAQETHMAWGVPAHVEPGMESSASAPKQVIMYGKCLSDFAVTEVCVDLCALIVEMTKREVKIPIIIVTRGCFARNCGDLAPGSLNNMAGTSMYALLRYIRAEIPSVPTSLVDISNARTVAQIPKCLAPTQLEAAYYHGAKFEPKIEAVPSLLRSMSSEYGGSGTGAKRQVNFQRKSFNWVGPNSKLDFVWFRQEWRISGAAEKPDPEEPSRQYPFNGYNQGQKPQ